MLINFFLSFIYNCVIVGFCFCTFSFIIWPLVAIIITRRFDPEFKHITKDMFGLGCFLRGHWYALMTVIPKRWVRPTSIPDRVFKGYDLWANATKFERSLACMHIIPAYIGTLVLTIFAINHFFHYLWGLFN